MAPPCEAVAFTDGDDVTIEVSGASSLESVGAMTDGDAAVAAAAAPTCGMFPCLSLMESTFLLSMEGVTPKQQQKLCNMELSINGTLSKYN